VDGDWRFNNIRLGSGYMNTFNLSQSECVALLEGPNGTDPCLAALQPSNICPADPRLELEPQAQALALPVVAWMVQGVNDGGRAVDMNVNVSVGCQAVTERATRIAGSQYGRDRLLLGPGGEVATDAPVGSLVWIYRAENATVFGSEALLAGCRSHYRQMCGWIPPSFPPFQCIKPVSSSLWRAVANCGITSYVIFHGLALLTSLIIWWSLDPRHKPKVVRLWPPKRRPSQGQAASGVDHEPRDEETGGQEGDSEGGAGGAGVKAEPEAGAGGTTDPQGSEAGPAPSVGECGAHSGDREGASVSCQGAVAVPELLLPPDFFHVQARRVGKAPWGWLVALTTAVYASALVGLCFTVGSVLEEGRGQRVLVPGNRGEGCVSLSSVVYASARPELGSAPVVSRYIAQNVVSDQASCLAYLDATDPCGLPGAIATAPAHYCPDSNMIAWTFTNVTVDFTDPSQIARPALGKQARNIAYYGLRPRSLYYYACAAYSANLTDGNLVTLCRSNYTDICR
jgi:hypothetical protein